jgi:hypothetical protein
MESHQSQASQISIPHILSKMELPHWRFDSFFSDLNLVLAMGPQAVGVSSGSSTSYK